MQPSYAHGVLQKIKQTNKKKPEKKSKNTKPTKHVIPLHQIADCMLMGNTFGGNSCIWKVQMGQANLTLQITLVLISAFHSFFFPMSD